MPRWSWGFIAGFCYIECLVLVCTCIHLPVKPDPIFHLPAVQNPFDYHWEAGPYDNDWDCCDPDLHICYKEQV